MALFILVTKFPFGNLKSKRNSWFIYNKLIDKLNKFAIKKLVNNKN